MLHLHNFPKHATTPTKISSEMRGLNFLPFANVIRYTDAAIVSNILCFLMEQCDADPHQDYAIL